MKNIFYLLHAMAFAVSLTMVGMDKTGERKARILHALMQWEYNSEKNMRTPRKGHANRSRSLRDSNKGEKRELNDYAKYEYERIKYHRS